MSNSAQSSNSLAAEEANQHLVDLLHQLEGRVAQALRLQHTPDDPYARDASMAMAVEIAYTLVSAWRQFLTILTLPTESSLGEVRSHCDCCAAKATCDGPGRLRQPRWHSAHRESP